MASFLKFYDVPTTETILVNSDEEIVRAADALVVFNGTVKR